MPAVEQVGDVGRGEAPLGPGGALDDGAYMVCGARRLHHAAGQPHGVAYQSLRSARVAALDAVHAGDLLE